MHMHYMPCTTLAHARDANDGLSSEQNDSRLGQGPPHPTLDGAGNLNRNMTEAWRPGQ